MGSKGSTDTQASRAQSLIARQLFAETDPLRRSLINQFTREFAGSPTQQISGQPIAQNLQTGTQLNIPEELRTISEKRALQAAQGKRFTGPAKFFAERSAKELEKEGLLTQSQNIAPNVPNVPTQGINALPTAQTGINLSESPVFRAGRNTLGQQFSNARQNIISSTPAGGALLDRLANLEAEKATAIGNLGAGITEADLNRAITLATGQTSQAQSGFGAAAASQAQQAQAQAQAKSGTGQAAGTAIGTYAAKAATGASDIRLKENLVKVGTLYNGLSVYVGNYIGEAKKQLFVIAQEVEEILPQAVSLVDGYKHVNYGMLAEV